MRHTLFLDEPYWQWAVSIHYGGACETWFKIGTQKSVKVITRHLQSMNQTALTATVTIKSQVFEQTEVWRCTSTDRPTLSALLRCYGITDATDNSVSDDQHHQLRDNGNNKAIYSCEIKMHEAKNAFVRLMKKDIVQKYIDFERVQQPRGNSSDKTSTY